MNLSSAYVGEDVPVTIEYEDDAGDPVDPDDTANEPTVTITDEEDTEVVSAEVMTANGTGDFEHVWDTAGESAGKYEIAVTADFNSETKIAKAEIKLEA